jgi:hypothetical protein
MRQTKVSKGQRILEISSAFEAFVRAGWGLFERNTIIHVHRAHDNRSILAKSTTNGTTWTGISMLAFRRPRLYRRLSPTESFQRIFPLRDRPNDSLLPSASPEHPPWSPFQ